MALVRARGDINATSHIDGATALHYAKDAALCKALLRAGANLEATEKASGRRPLHQAVEYDRVDVLEALLAAKASVNAVNAWDITTALHNAKSSKAATVLIAAGASLDAVATHPQVDQWQPLHMAAHGGHAGVVQAILRSKADLNAADAKGRNAAALAKSFADGHKDAPDAKQKDAAHPCCERHTVR